MEKNMEVLGSILGPPGASPGSLVPSIVFPYFSSFAHVEYRPKLSMCWPFPGTFLFCCFLKCRFLHFWELSMPDSDSTRKMRTNAMAIVANGAL